MLSGAQLGVAGPALAPGNPSAESMLSPTGPRVLLGRARLRSVGVSRGQCAGGRGGRLEGTLEGTQKRPEKDGRQQA